ncbi:MAG: nuclear transport factor 2 family protein [Solirubrobacterales bacterium]
MSKDDLATVEALWKASAERDLETAAQLLDPAIVLYGTRGGLDEKRVLTGPDAYLGYMTDVEAQWENFDFEVERLIDAGEAIVVFLLEKGRSGRGEAELLNETAMAFKVNEGKVVEARGFLDREEAIEAARQGKLSG